MEASTFETILCFSQAVLKIDLILNFINKKKVENFRKWKIFQVKIP